MRHVVFAGLGLLGAVLVACGDEPPSAPDPTKRLSREDLEKLMGNRADGQAMAREMEAALKERMGPNFVEDAQKAKALSERPLTAQDVETYLAVAPQLRTASKDRSGWEKVLAERGLSQPEWGVLMGRMMQVRMLLRSPSAKVDAKLQADVETVRPYADRIDAASRDASSTPSKDR